jgi:hypothetical protein
LDKRVRFNSRGLPWALMAPQLAIVLIFFFEWGKWRRKKNHLNLPQRRKKSKARLRNLNLAMILSLQKK